MQNSFSLGLLHGALYGITPITPWFIGLKRYVLNGQTKGLLTFAGLFLGQVLLLLLAFFGGTELLWLWYYLEPVLIVIGAVAVLKAFTLCYKRIETPTPLGTRKEGLLYFATGMAFAICNPGGIMFGNLLLTTLPENSISYILGFVLFYLVVSAGLLYITCLSPLGQRVFGQWSITRMRNGQEPSADFFTIRLRAVQSLAILTLFTLCVQFLRISPSSFTTYYVDTMFGATPAKEILPKRDYVWIESTEEVASEDGDEENTIEKVWKLQSPLNGNKYVAPDQVIRLNDQSPWNIVSKYNTYNEKLEREEISDELKELEVENYDEKGPNSYYLKWLKRFKFRLMFKPEWGTEDEMDARLLKQLTNVRFEMDDILRTHYAASLNEARPHLPFNMEYEQDYDFDSAAVAQDRLVTEDNLIDLETLKADPDLQREGYFTKTYDMVHRGGETIDFSIATLQDLPKEVNFPWDFPVVHAPNVPEIATGIQEEEPGLVTRRNEVQNNNVWFLDPIALNTRFLANDPLPASDPRWSGPDSETFELRAPNTIRRWWLGEDLVSEADVEMPVQTARETIMAKVIPGSKKHH